MRIQPKQYKILLVHNKFRIEDPITYLSWVIRKVTDGEYNHVAIQVDNEVIESVGEGVVISSFDEWYHRSDRKVLPMFPRHKIHEEDHKELMSRIGNHYGYGDILRTGIYYILKKRWGLNVKRPMNGVGDTCNELGLMLLNIDDLLVPHEFENLSMLIKGTIFYTHKTTK